MEKFVLNRIYRVVGYKNGCDEKLKKRMCEFGFVQGATFFISYKSMLGKNYIVEIKGFVLSLKKTFLSLLEVA